MTARRTAAALMFVALATASAFAAAPAAVTVPALPRAGVIDPQRVPLAPRAAAPATPALVPNLLDGPSTGMPRPAPWSAPPARDVIRVIDPGDARTPQVNPAIDIRIEGPFDNGIAPTDAVMAAGRGHVIELVNSLVQFNTRAGAVVGGPWKLKDFFGIPDGFGISDPGAVYDALNDRFIATVMADNGTTRDARMCVAFSTTGDPTQPWNRYFIDADLGQPQNWLDYPAIGADRFALYITGNMWDRTAGFSNVTVYVYGTDEGYRGLPLRGTHLIDVRTTGNGAPFALRPAVVAEIAKNDEMWFQQMDGSSDKINLFRLRGDRFHAPEFTAFSVPTPSIYVGPGNARQPGSGDGVNSGGGHSWNTFYRNGTLWLTNALRGGTGVISWVHKVDVSVDPPVRLKTWQIEGGLRDVYFPHVVPDPVTDDFALFSAYSGNDVYVTGRYWNVDGTTGAVRSVENMAAATQRNTSGRHGDYFAVGADPLDRNRVWGIAQYMVQSTFSGNDRVASVRVKDLPVPVPPVPVPEESVRAVRAADGQVAVTWDASVCAAPNHHLVWFDLAAIKSYPTVAETCAIGSGGTWTGAAPAGNVAFVVVADDGSTAEGSHGGDWLGRERPSQARACGITQKVWSAVCSAP